MLSRRFLKSRDEKENRGYKQTSKTNKQSVIQVRRREKDDAWTTCPSSLAKKKKRQTENKNEKQQEDDNHTKSSEQPGRKNIKKIEINNTNKHDASIIIITQSTYRERWTQQQDRGRVCVLETVGMMTVSRSSQEPSHRPCTQGWLLFVAVQSTQIQREHSRQRSTR